MRVRFCHEWEVPMARHQVWEVLASALEDSSRSPVWPNHYSSIRMGSRRLTLGAILHATYHFGVLSKTSDYRIEDLEKGKRVVYRATEDHALRGGAEITLSSSVRGTHFRWEGAYETKSIFGWLPIAWFKLTYESRFFGELERKFKDLSVSLAA